MRYSSTLALSLCLCVAADGIAAVADDVEMIDVAGGTFAMGSDEELSAPIASNLPAHMVTVSAFRMSKYEVTNRQFTDFLNEAEVAGQIEVRDDLPGPPSVYVVGADTYPSAGQKLYHLGGTNQEGENELNRPWIDYDEGAVVGMRFQILDSQDVFGNDEALDTADWPANFVLWDGATAFAAFRDLALPTEAQWEYAAQGGAGNPYGTADGTLSLENANYSGQDSPGEIAEAAVGHAVAVGSYPANPFGLFDLAGNVWEWTADNYDPAFYGNSEGAIDPFNRNGIDGTPNDPAESEGCAGGPSTVYDCNTRLKRGGSWNFHSVTIRSEARNTDYVFRGNDHFGARVVEATAKPKKTGKLRAKAEDDGAVILSWNDRSDDESSFELECKGKGKWTHLAKVVANVETVTSDTLETGTKYKCRVRARNSVGTSRWKRKKVDLR